jgi:hypothetical protein
MATDINEKLGQFLREGQDWEKKPTNIPGALLKLRTFKKSPPSIAIEIKLESPLNHCCMTFVLIDASIAAGICIIIL